jgi:hypothetical protein
MEMTLYRIVEDRPLPVVVDIAEFTQMIRAAAYRFWLSERRVPSAVIFPRQVATALLSSTGKQLVGNIMYLGEFAVDDHTSVPMLTRDSSLDPMFQFI